MSNDSEATQSKRFRWHHFYYVLAVFDIISVCVTLALGHAIMGIYLDSVHTNASWVERVHAFNKLGTLASKLNEPGNDVFKTKDIPQERARLAQAQAVFDEHFAAVESNVSKQIQSPDREELLEHLKDIKEYSQGIVREAKLVFVAFEGKADTAGSHMADMDTQYGQLLSSLTKLTQRVSVIQAEHFNIQVNNAENLKRFEYVIVVFIVLMVCAVALYGHKLGANMIQTSENLKQSEARFRALSEAFPQVVFEAKEMGEITFLNNAGRRVLNRDLSSELSGLNIVDFAVKEQRYEVFEWLRHWQSDNRVNGLEIKVQSENVSHGIMYCNRFQHSSGEMVFTGLLVDITDLKLLEVELRKAKQVADSNSEAKSDFLAKMSHELRTPIGGILGMLDILLRKGLNTDQLDYAQTAYNSAEALLSLINDILDFSKIEAEKLELEHINFDLRSVVENVSDLLTLKASSKNLEFLVDFPIKIPTHLKGDPTRIRQILINLINNAIKFTSAGEVILRVSQESADNDKVNLHFEVSDTGIGISKSDQESLFEAFKQADKGTSRRYGGTGLGLSICKELTELMGGKIGVRSEPGVGSTFWITIPFDKQTESTHSLSETRFTTLRVLVIDSSKTSRALLQNYVEAWGCHCETATTSEQAVTKLRTATRENTPFTLILLDADSSEMNSVNLAKTIDSDQEIKAAQKILLSANKEILSEMAEASETFNALLTKPVKQSQLLDALSQTCSVDRDLTNNQPRSTPTSKAVTFKSARVLVAEDNPTNQKLIIHLLSEMKVENVKLVHNGREAVSICNREAFDLIILDGIMPELNGCEAAEAIRKSKINAGTPIIALTAESMKGDKERFFSAGMNGYLSKPFKSTEFFDTIGTYLSTNETEQLPSIGTFKVLIVDDNAINRKILESYMEEIGGACTLAEDGEVAIAEIQKRDFDLILLDCHMPRKNGYETARWIRHWERGRSRMPIIAVTADVSIGNEDRCREAGMDGYVSKPIQPELLCETVKNFLKIDSDSLTDNNQSEDEVFSPEILKGISAGDKAFELSFLGSAITDLERYQEELPGKFESENWEDIKRLIHTIAGVAGNIGAAQLCARSQELESKIRAEAHSEVMATRTAYNEILETTLKAMKDYQNTGISALESES